MFAGLPLTCVVHCASVQTSTFTVDVYVPAPSDPGGCASRKSLPPDCVGQCTSPATMATPAVTVTRVVTAAVGGFVSVSAIDSSVSSAAEVLAVSASATSRPTQRTRIVMKPDFLSCQRGGWE